jgi:hypothetical protein
MQLLFRPPVEHHALGLLHDDPVTLVHHMQPLELGILAGKFVQPFAVVDAVHPDEMKLVRIFHAQDVYCYPMVTIIPPQATEIFLQHAVVQPERTGVCDNPVVTLQIFGVDHGLPHHRLQVVQPALIGKREERPAGVPDDAEGVPGEVAFVDFPGLLTQGKVIQQGDAAALALMPCLGDVGDSAVAQPGTARRGEEEP